MGQPLYRFTSFQSFVDVVQSKQLTFVKPESWDDTYEGYVYKLLYKYDDIDKLNEQIQKLDPQFDTNTEFLREESKKIYAQCWSIKAETDALWRINSHQNMAIRIEIDANDIEKLHKVNRKSILYVKELDLIKELKKISTSNKKSTVTASIFTPTEGIITKRKAFKHEKEVRLIHWRRGYVQSVIDSIEESERLKKIDEFYTKGNIKDEVEFNYWKCNPKVLDYIKIPFDHIPTFIKSVMLHPQAPEWFNHTLRKYCEINDLNYLGKSKLYEKL